MDFLDEHVMPLQLAVLFDNLGPYHIARLKAVAQRCDLLGIEQRAISTEYAWAPAAQVPFRRVTLLRKQSGRQPYLAADIHRAVHRALTEFGPEAVVVPGWATALSTSAVGWANARGVPVVLMSASQEIDFERTALREWVKRRYVSNCDGAIVGGTPHREYLVKLGMDPSRIRLGYDVVDNEHFRCGAAQARENAAAVRKQMGLPARYFLTVTRFIEKKNLSRLLQAFASFLAATDSDRTDSRPWHLVVLGDGELRPLLEDQVSSLGLADRVLMPGFKQYPELPTWYALAEALVLGSTTEQWGLVVNEAMASGLPVLVSNRCGCAANLVSPGVNGYTFDPHDTARLASLMARIAEEPTRRRTMGDASVVLIDKWSPAIFADNLVGLVEELKALPARRPTLMDRTVLNLMLARHRAGV